MALLAPIIGNHAFIVIEGETVDGVTVGPTAAGLPDDAPESNWRNLGCIETASYNFTREGQTQVFCPSPGSYELANEKYTSSTLTVSLGLANPNVDFWTLAFGASSVSGTGVFTPGSSGQPTKGWVKIQAYESGTENNVVNMQFWCTMTVDGDVTFSNSRTQPTLQLKIIANILNSGQLLNGMASATT